MPDLSQIPFGPGVSIQTGQKKDLGYLFDPNAAVYKIESSRSEWHMLFIRAKNDVGFDGSPPGTNGWQFTLESASVEKVKKIYTKGEPEYDPPRVCDSLGSAVPLSLDEAVPFLGLYTGDTSDVNYTTNINFDDGPSIPLTIETKVRFRQQMVQEAGTYIMPICYHIMTDAGLDIRQVARSDWSFWPMPQHCVWHRYFEILDFSTGTTIPE